MIRNRTRCIVLCLFVGYISLYLFTAPKELPEGDEAIMLGVADRIFHHGFSRLPPKTAMERLSENQIFSNYGFTEQSFSKYGVGQSLITIPVVWAFRKAVENKNKPIYTFYVLIVFSISALLGAALNAIFFLTCLKLGYKLKTSFFLTLIMGMTTLVWPYSQTSFSDPTLGLLWMLSFYALLTYKSTRKKPWLGIAGGALGYSVLTKIVALYTVPIIASYFLYLLISEYHSVNYQNKRRFFIDTFLSTSWFITPLFATGAMLLWYNHLRYGKFFAFGYFYGSYDIRDSYFGFNTPLLAGLYGILLSTGKGFFFYNPSTILAFYGIKKFYRQHKAETMVIIGIISGLILIHASWWSWHGDFSWGPRLVSGLPPFFILLSGSFLEDICTNWGKRQTAFTIKASFVTLLLLISFAVQIPGLCIKSNDYILTAAKADVFKKKFYQANWPIRDDTLQIHFIPEFSPLIGHIWMMQSIYHRDDSKFKDIYQSPPWKKLNSLWVFKSFEETHFHYNIWWLYAMQKASAEAPKMLMLALLLLGMAVSSFGFGLFIATKEPFT